MDINAPRWDEYETAFRQVVPTARLWEGTRPPLDCASLYLCLYGENGLTPEQEFDLLEQIQSATSGTLYRLEVEADYWQDTILFRWP